MPRSFLFFFVLAVVVLALACGPLRPWGYLLCRELAVAWGDFRTRDWKEIAGEHFVVKFLPGDEEEARLVLSEAERVYAPLGRFLSCFPEQRTLILLYPDAATLNRAFGWRSGEGAMGVYWLGVIRLLPTRCWLGEPSSRKEALAAYGAVAHEYLHLLVDLKTRGNYPRWLTEGIAQYGEEEYAGARPSCYRLQEPFPSLAALEAAFAEGRDEEGCYATARALVSFYLCRYGEERLLKLLALLGRGATVEEAFRGATGEHPEAFYASWSASRTASLGGGQGGMTGAAENIKL